MVELSIRAMATEEPSIGKELRQMQAEASHREKADKLEPRPWAVPLVIGNIRLPRG
jgi:hypothetical protein